MRILVVGASGYVGSRVIPALLDRGHVVRAGVRNPQKLDKFYWRQRVEHAAVDASDPEALPAALQDIDAVVYLVHGMGSHNFRDSDLQAARNIRISVDQSDVRRLVYVSGLIPDVPKENLSEHLVSRWEVEEELSRSGCSAVTLRAALIIGSGSTSYELMGQLSQRLPITVLPNWMKKQVEPVAVLDLIAAVIGAVEQPLGTESFDIGGGHVLSYPDLIKTLGDIAGMPRPQVSVPWLPGALVGKAAALITDVPGPTVTALIESLREDMVTRDARWIGGLVPACYRPLPIATALARALLAPNEDLDASGRDVMAALPGDPDWAVASAQARKYTATGIPPRESLRASGPRPRRRSTNGA